MGPITNWSFRNADAVLMLFGMAGGALLGGMGGSWFGAALGAVFGGVLTFAAMHVEPHDPEYGPHQ